MNFIVFVVLACQFYCWTILSSLCAWSLVSNSYGLKDMQCQSPLHQVTKRLQDQRLEVVLS